MEAGDDGRGQPRRPAEGHRRRLLTCTLALKAKGVPVPDIAKKLTIKPGKNVGSPPSVASLDRAFAEAEAEQAAANARPLRPKLARILPDDASALREGSQDRVPRGKPPRPD